MDLSIIFVISYLLGSLPYGLILVKIFKNQDIRTIGSKNIGATNVLRAGYPILALITLLADALKGAIAVIIFRYLIIFENHSVDYYALAGVFAVIGHMFPIWLKFKGGKGVATAIGTILALNPIIGLLCMLTWLIVALITKYSSLSAIIATLLLPLWTLLIQKEILLYCIIMASIVLIKHKDNIIRLLKKQETKITFKKKNDNK